MAINSRYLTKRIHYKRKYFLVFILSEKQSHLNPADFTRELIYIRWKVCLKMGVFNVYQKSCSKTMNWYAKLTCRIHQPFYASADHQGMLVTNESDLTCENRVFSVNQGWNLIGLDMPDGLEKWLRASLLVLQK